MEEKYIRKIQRKKILQTYRQRIYPGYKRNIPRKDI